MMNHENASMPSLYIHYIPRTPFIYPAHVTCDGCRMYVGVVWGIREGYVRDVKGRARICVGKNKKNMKKKIRKLTKRVCMYHYTSLAYLIYPSHIPHGVVHM